MEQTFTLHFDAEDDVSRRLWDDILDVFRKEHFACGTNHMLLSYELGEEKFPVSNIIMTESHDEALLHEVHKSIFEKDDPDSATMDFIKEMTHTDGIKGFIFTKKDGEEETIIGMCFLLIEKRSACLCGFGIIPDYQQTGYGSKCLRLICNYLSDIPEIKQLRVEANGLNQGASKLYLGFGFAVAESYTQFVHTED